MKNHIERNYDSIIEILEKDIKAEKELIELLETSNKILNPIDLFEYVEIIEEKLQMITYLEVSDGKLDVPDEIYDKITTYLSFVNSPERYTFLDSFIYPNTLILHIEINEIILFSL